MSETLPIEDRDSSADEVGASGAEPSYWAFELLRPGSTLGIAGGSALTYAAFWACVRLISQTIASLGWHQYESQGEKGKRRVFDDTSWVLDTQANPEMSAFDFRQVMTKDALVWGNGYAEIERDGFGRLRWVYRIDPSRVTPTRNERGNLIYEVRNSSGGEKTVLAPEQVFHLKGLGPDGLIGWSVIEMFRRTLKTALTTAQYGESFFRRGPMPGGILKSRGSIDKAKRDELREQFERTYGGGENAGKVIVLFGDMEFEPLSMPNSDAQFIESQRFSSEDVCRIFGVPPHKIGNLERATFSNIESQAIEFVQDCLLPWCRRLETEADLKLYGRQMRGRRWTKLNLQTLLRGDSATQVNNVTRLVTSGINTVNEAREYFDLNPIDDGDTPLIQGAMTTLERAANPPENDPAPAPPAEPMPDEKAPEEPPENVARTFTKLLASAYDRTLRVEADKARRANNKGLLADHVAAHYSAEFTRSLASDALSPIVSALALAAGSTLDLTGEVAGELAMKHRCQSVDDLSLGVKSVDAWGFESGRSCARAVQQATEHLAIAWKMLTQGDEP